MSASADATSGPRRGWEGLTHLRPGPAPAPAYVLPLDREPPRAIDRVGGTMLHTSRTNPRRMRADRIPEHLRPEVARLEAHDGRYDLTALVLRNLEALGLDRLVVIGGDDPLSSSQG